MANIEQAQQMIPLITRETSFGQNVSELFFGCRCIRFGSWNPDLFDRTTNSRATLWVLENVSYMVRTSPFNDHFDHCFIVFEHIQQSFLTR